MHVFNLSCSTTIQMMVCKGPREDLRRTLNMGRGGWARRQVISLPSSKPAAQGKGINMPGTPLVA